MAEQCVFCVAEKPSLALAIAGFLSDAQHSTRSGGGDATGVAGAGGAGGAGEIVAVATAEVGSPGASCSTLRPKEAARLADQTAGGCSSASSKA